jgi:MFS family permease
MIAGSCRVSLLDELAGLFIAFAVYAVAVAISLVLAGHLSDTSGRRRLLVPAITLNVVAGLVFVVWPALPGLLVARVLSGLGVGAATATASVWLAELEARRRPGAGSHRAQIISTAANLGGLGLGGLIAGILAATRALLGGRGHGASTHPQPLTH